MKKGKFVACHRRVDVPIYFGYLHVAICQDMAGAVKELGIDRPSDPVDLSGFGALTTERHDSKGVTHWYVLLPPTSKPGVIAHEAKHLVNFIFVSRGIALDTHNDEPECYLLGWVVEQIYAQLRRYLKKSKARR